MTKVTYLEEQLNKKMEENQSIVALIGLGKNAKQLYLDYIKKHNIELVLVVELESKKENTKTYLEENGFSNTKIFSIPDELKSSEHLPQNIFDNLVAVSNILEITHVIIDTEPKSHYMYLEFALKNNIHVLTDLPITITQNIDHMKKIKAIKNQYYNILDLSNSSESICKIMCQKQYHRGYEYILQQIDTIVKKYQIPITYISIDYSNGLWQMPHDILCKENYPYRFLFEEGYHYINFLSDLLQMNNQLSESKKIVDGEIYTNCLTLEDTFSTCNQEDYKRLFKNQDIPTYYDGAIEIPKGGEGNFYSLMKFMNKEQQTITNVNLNLSHYGFSRRGQIEENTGAVKHEYMSIQIGTLFKIQVHSYQSKEEKDRKKSTSEENVGGLDHFDIDIYRNVDIIGGKAFERIKLSELYNEKEAQETTDYDSLAKENYLKQFLNKQCNQGDMKQQALGMELLYGCILGIHNVFKNKKGPVKIQLKNRYTQPVIIEDLKKCSTKINSKEKKDAIDCYEISGIQYEFGVVMNQIYSNNHYEVYLYVSNHRDKADLLFYRDIKHIFIAKLYFQILKKVARTENMNRIAKLLRI